MKSQANTHNPTWLPGGGAGRPNGLTEGVWFVEWKQLKATNGTPFAASRHFPQRGQRGPVRIRPSLGKNVTAYRRKPLRLTNVSRPQLCMKQLYAVEDGYTC